ncbi:hypothetical protein E2C01_018250 [Portunus trituberculatus]|uniref:Uncharacterized protein n=1 Tax=Portunus trituberculatus TaxID=210409 RepID=A0A5B7DUM0_PORTR|nr:hypothetical protein [Portunus trituberculatus]
MLRQGGRGCCGGDDSLCSAMMRQGGKGCCGGDDSLCSAMLSHLTLCPGVWTP